MISDTGEPPSRGEQVPADAPSSLSDTTTPYGKPWRPAHPLGSFTYAIEGIVETFRAERNFRVHAALTICVLTGGVLLHFSALKLVALLLTAAIVLAAELLNTAIEATIDLAMPDRHPLAKRAKDASAGAVLVTAIFAVCVGLLLFIPALIPLVAPLLKSVSPVGVPFFLAGLVFIVVATVFFIARRKGKKRLPDSALDLSREAVIGVALLTLGVSGVYRAGADNRLLPDVASVRISSMQHIPALAPSAGVP